MAPKQFMPQLVVIEGQDKGKIIPLQGGTAIIGRSKGDIIIRDSKISRSHVAIIFDAKKNILSFTDLKSLNGTFINGKTYPSGKLEDGDKLKIGDTVFDCQLQQEKKVFEETGKKEPYFQKSIEEQASAWNEIPAKEMEKEDKEKTNFPNPKLSKTPRKKTKKPLFHTPHILKQNKKVVYSGAFIFLLFIYLFSGSSSNETSILKELQSLKAQKKWDSAILLLKSSLENSPNNTKLLMELADLYENQNAKEYAIQTLRQAHGLKDAPSIVHVRLAKQLSQSGFQREAAIELEHIEALIQKGIADKSFFVEAGNLFLNEPTLKQPAEKIFIIAKALQNDIASQSSEGYKLEAKIWMQKNDLTQATKSLELALQKDPQDEWIYENLILVLYHQKELLKGKVVATKWIQKFQKSTRALLVMANLHLSQNENYDAKNYLQRIVELSKLNAKDPYYPQALYLLGQLHILENKVEEGSRMIAQSCELGFEEGCKREEDDSY